MDWCRRVESTRRSWTAVACLLQRREHSIVGDLLELGLAALTALVDDIEPDGILLPLYEPRCRNRGYNDDCDRHPLDGLLRLWLIYSNISQCSRNNEKKVHARPAASLEARAYPK
jgi:hypothetical protein